MTKLQIAGHLIRTSDDFFLDVAAGAYPELSVINKFGEAPSGIQTSETDIWTRADATPTQQIWLAPTAARVHSVVSSNNADTGFNVRVYGLQTWDSVETSEVVAMGGTVPVNTANSYVIIHRMKMTATAAKTSNAGNITATAETDSTVTAVIGIGDGQTEMAIYGVPSVQTAYLYNWFAGIDKASGVAASIAFTLRVNENPNAQTTGFLRKDDLHVQSTGTGTVARDHRPPLKFAGPCIIKVQGLASSADTDGSAVFDMILARNDI